VKGRMVLGVLASMAYQLFPTPYAAAADRGGVASVYSTESGSGTASGQKLNPHALTAAHRSLPFGTKVKVTNKHNGRAVVVTINDRGPFVRGRVIDLTPAAARVLGFSGLGRPVQLVGGYQRVGTRSWLNARSGPDASMREARTSDLQTFLGRTRAARS
jgi:peptidoglycan lytic transglycosylase